MMHGRREHLVKFKISKIYSCNDVSVAHSKSSVAPWKICVALWGPYDPL
jgi:hypothetical protein